MDTIKAEFLLAWDNHTWTTQVFDVPVSLEDESDEEYVNWANENLLPQAQYRRVVLIALTDRHPSDG